MSYNSYLFKRTFRFHWTKPLYFFTMARYMFQRNKKLGNNVFDIPDYNVFKKYLLILGQYPYQTDLNRKINLTVFVCSATSLLIPSIIQFFKSIREKDLDMVMECVPIINTLLVSTIKLLNHNINRKKFEKLFDMIKEEWEMFEINNEIHVSNKITKQGAKMGELYRSSLLTFLVLFILIPLAPPFLDIVAPLNETRTRQQMLKLNYIINTDEYFYIIYLHSAWCSIAIVIIIVTIDSLYMVIVHYACGLFAVCGYQIKMATQNNDLSVNTTIRENIAREQFRRCVITHHKVIQFCEYIVNSTCNSYLLQVGLNLIGITVTAIQTVIYFNRPEEAIRISMFLVAEQFHLFVLSLPGQILLDQSDKLTNDIYFSKWYQIPLKFRTMLHTMQIRSKKSCQLTAGGIYIMNIENFGSLIKTCVSYFTVLMSLRE